MGIYGIENVLISTSENSEVDVDDIIKDFKQHSKICGKN